MKRSLRLVLAAGVFLLAVNEAGAQFGGGGFPGGGGMGRRGSRGSTDSDKATQRPAQSEARADLFQTTLEELRIDLKLDAAQQSAWNAYTTKLAALMSDLIRERNRSLPGVTTVAPQGAPQQLDRMVMSAQNRATAIEDVAGAAKTLYAMLSPEQKTIADARLANVTSMAVSPQTSAPPPGTRGSGAR